MTLSPSTRLAPHFTAAELGADTPGIPAAAENNLYLVASWLEAARGILGVPLIVTSGYRTPAHNEAVGGSATSDHPNGLAADWEPSGLSLYKSYQLLKSAPPPPFDQLIFYPDGHIHVGLGSRMRGEYRLALLEGGYPLITPELAAQLRSAAPGLLLLLLAVLLIVAIPRKG